MSNEQDLYKTWVLRPAPIDSVTVWYREYDNSMVCCSNAFPHEGWKDFGRKIYFDHYPFRDPSEFGYELIGVL